MGRLLFVASLSLFVAAACSDDSNGTTDGKVKTDGPGPQPDTGPPPTELVCNSDCADLVLSSITLPDTTTASKVGHDYDNDGTIDNALGAILGGLAQMAGGSLNIQEALDKGVNKGSTLVLLRMQADDFASDSSSKAQAWTGAPMSCCSDPEDVTGCAAEAKTTCFGGTHTFYPDKASPKDAIFGGTITGGKALYGPSKLKFVLPFTGAGDLELNLQQVYLKGTVGAGGKNVTDGILAGAITQSDLNTKLIPTVKDMLNTTLADPTTDAQVKSIITSLFDADQDGTITEAEVKDSTIVKTFLGGDKDVDGDGVKELTLGVAFEAISAVIDETGTPPDMGVTPDAGPGDAAVGD